MCLPRTIYDAGTVMHSKTTAHNDAAAGRAGTIVVLIDESSEMAAPIPGGTKSKVESVATAVN